MLKYLKNVVSLDLDGEKCIGCGMCSNVCPHAVFTVTGGKAHIIERDLCMECGACALNCPVSALTVQTGVGCTAAIVSSFFSGKEVSCDCSGGDCC